MDADEWDGKNERRRDYKDNGYEEADFDNGYREEEGQVVKRVTIITLYRKMEQLEKAVEKLCEKATDIREVAEKQQSLEKLLGEHLDFCRDFRAEKRVAQTEQETYQKGYNDAIEKAENQVKNKFKESMTFWAKIIIPASAVLFGLLYWIFDRLLSVNNGF